MSSRSTESRGQHSTPTVILAIDTHYSSTHSRTAGVLFSHWSDPHPHRELLTQSEGVAPYQPGQFYKRELPPILGLLSQLESSPSVVVIDGYVWLDAQQTPGLGAHLYTALGQSTPIMGVAKSAFRGSSHAVPVLRGTSRRPLYVTAAGMPVRDAARHLQIMHGAHRLPDLLRRVDQLCRQTR